jgi:putative DNA-binding protein
MLSLRDLEAEMAGALFSDPSERLIGVIAADGLAPVARLAIYRHHVFTTLTATLQAVYPVVCRLVDQRFFAFAAHGFVRHHPPSGPCLFDYGREFPAFLASFPPCQALSYLPDVARLEWALNAALHADDATPLDLARLRRLAADQSERVTFEFDPSVTLVASPYPVDQIWRANQPDAGDPGTVVDLRVGGVTLEVRRLDDNIVFRSLARCDYVFRRALSDGRRLGDAAAAATAENAAFDLVEALRALFEEGVLVGFTIS